MVFLLTTKCSSNLVLTVWYTSLFSSVRPNPAIMWLSLASSPIVYTSAFTCIASGLPSRPDASRIHFGHSFGFVNTKESGQATWHDCAMSVYYFSKNSFVMKHSERKKRNSDFFLQKSDFFPSKIRFFFSKIRFFSFKNPMFLSKIRFFSSKSDFFSKIRFFSRKSDLFSQNTHFFRKHTKFGFLSLYAYYYYYFSCEMSK